MNEREGVQHQEAGAASTNYDGITCELERMAAILQCPVMPIFLSDFESFKGSADDYDWKAWETSTSNKHVCDFELQSIDTAERLIEGEGSEFGEKLKLLRADMPDLQPISSGMHIFPWLLLLREERDDARADACELY